MERLTWYPRVRHAVLARPLVIATVTALALAVLSAVGYVDQRLEPSIYDATPGTLIELADGHKDVERLLLVGHNPGFEQLAALMHSGQSGDYRGMPPGGIAVLSVPKDAAIEPGVARLAAFWWP